MSIVGKAVVITRAGLLIFSVSGRIASISTTVQVIDGEGQWIGCSAVIR